MKGKIFILFALLFTLGLMGCSRTIDDVANWKAKGNIEKLIEALTDSKVEVRLAATEALGELKVELAVDHLATLFNDSEETVIVASVNALASIGSPSITTPMIAALQLENSDVRTIAAIALGELAASGAIQPLIDALNDSEAAVQLASAHSLGQIGDEKGSEALVGKLDASTSVELRVACAKSLAMIGGDVAAKGLIGALKDSDATVGEIAVTSLVQLGESSIPFALEALKDEYEKIRSGSVAVLQELNAVPLKGSHAIWFQLALVSINPSDDINPDVIDALVILGDKMVDTLLEAAAHTESSFREHASLTLERIGDACTAKAINAAGTLENSSAQAWFESRKTWNGFPSWRLDLWGAVASLNPEFNIDQAQMPALQAQGRIAYNLIKSAEFNSTRAYIPLLISLLGDETAPPPEQPDYDAEGIPVVKKFFDPFRGEINQLLAKKKLAEAGYLATFPLISAIEDENILVAGHAAEILGEQGEKRALAPLMNVVRKKVNNGEVLTTSPFYTALQKMDSPDAESLLLKVRPNSRRAMRVFERNYVGVRPVSAETEDGVGDSTRPVIFLLGYIFNGKINEMMVTFKKDEQGNWKPSPQLPAEPLKL